MWQTPLHPWADLPARPRGLIVGEAPGHATDARMPLFPHPVGSSAGRLMTYAGMTYEQYLSRLERVNLCDETWSADAATSRAADLLKWLLTSDNLVDGHPMRVLLLGQRVRTAWFVHAEPKQLFGYTRWMFGAEDDPRHHIQIAFAPHPSGLSRVYNSTEARARVGRYVRWCAGLPLCSQGVA